MEQLKNVEKLILNKTTNECSMLSLIVDQINQTTNDPIDLIDNLYAFQHIIYAIRNNLEGSISYLTEKWDRYSFKPSFYLTLDLGNMRLAHQLNEYFSIQEIKTLIQEFIDQTGIEFD